MHAAVLYLYQGLGAAPTAAEISSRLAAQVADVCEAGALQAVQRLVRTGVLDLVDAADRPVTAGSSSAPGLRVAPTTRLRPVAGALRSERSVIGVVGVAGAPEAATDVLGGPWPRPAPLASLLVLLQAELRVQVAPGEWELLELLALVADQVDDLASPRTALTLALLQGTWTPTALVRLSALLSAGDTVALQRLLDVIDALGRPALSALPLEHRSALLAVPDRALRQRVLARLACPQGPAVPATRPRTP